MVDCPYCNVTMTDRTNDRLCENASCSFFLAENVQYALPRLYSGPHRRQAP